MPQNPKQVVPRNCVVVYDVPAPFYSLYFSDEFVLDGAAYGTLEFLRPGPFSHEEGGVILNELFAAVIYEHYSDAEGPLNRLNIEAIWKCCLVVSRYSLSSDVGS